MPQIKTLPFKKESIKKIKNFDFGRNWPVVYIIEDGKEAYIGETVSAYGRAKQHYKKEERKKLNNIHIIYDGEYNKSATLDIESWLIQYMVADGGFSLQNGNEGLKNHNYYDRTRYRAKFETVWERLKIKKKIVGKDLIDLRNSDLFKYSPYKKLTDDQISIAKEVTESLKQDESNTYLIKGEPGTGKTVLATYLFKRMKDSEEFSDLKIGLVIPQTSLRHSIKKVFKNIKNLKANMVLNPSQVVESGYDVLIVDEAHRLKRRKNITNYGVFDKNNEKLGLGKGGDQLDWITISSKSAILLYDENQSIRPSDVRADKFKNLDSKNYSLESQIRVKGGEDYLSAINNFFEFRKIDKKYFPDYDFRICDDIEQMIEGIKEKNRQEGLSRVLAGYAWPWRTRAGEADYDIEIDGYKLKWNHTTSNWINTKESINEVGCIHTVQGYDLNYAGVIIGPEISYNPHKKEFQIDKDNYYDRNGYAGVDDPEELKRYIINIYKVLLTRGIKGTYVYIVDDDLRKYFNHKLK